MYSSSGSSGSSGQYNEMYSSRQYNEVYGSSSGRGREPLQRWPEEQRLLQLVRGAELDAGMQLFAGPGWWQPPPKAPVRGDSLGGCSTDYEEEEEAVAEGGRL